MSDLSVSSKMMFIKLYFQPALLLLVLSCPVWQVSQSLPVMGKQPATDACVLHAGFLLNNITDVLAQTKLFSGFKCAEQNMEQNNETVTPSACAVKGLSCNGKTVSHFDQEACVTNIGKDLSYYYKFLNAQSDPESLLTPTLLSLREFTKNCFMDFLPMEVPLKETAADRTSTFTERLNLCKLLRGFQVRAITINRVISHMNFGEQK